MFTAGLAMLADMTSLNRDVCFTPKSGHWLSAARCPLCARNGHEVLLDFRSCPHQIAFRRASLQSPGLPKALCPSTALKPAHRVGDFGKCLISPEFSSDSGNRFRAFDSRPVSCHMQPSVVSLLRRRDMLRTNNANSLDLEAESSGQPASKPSPKGN